LSGIALALALAISGAAAPSSTSTGAPALPDLSGSWAQATVTTAVSDLPFFGETDVATTAILKVTITQEGAALTLVETLCDLHTGSPSRFVRTEYPTAFLRALSGHRRAAALERRADGRVAFVEARRVRVLGARLERPERDPLPARPDDPRLVDPDRDKRPGATVHVRGVVSGELQVVQRASSALDGMVAGDGGAIDGRVAWTTEQVVIDATRDLFRDPPPSWPHPDAARSFFRLRRVPETATCGDLVARKAALLGLTD
jgi:hypothetical protein